MHIDYTILLDATEDDCPLPTIRAKRTLDAMNAGEILKLVTSKEGTIKNIRTFTRGYPCMLITEQKSAEGLVFYIQKTEAIPGHHCLDLG